MIDFWMMVTKDESEEGLDIGNEKVLGLRKKRNTLLHIHGCILKSIL